jgi:IclR family acetate operon transcriptional repressor
MSGRGVERVLDMMEWFAAHPEPASLTYISTALKLPKSSALLLLKSLVERGYVQRTQTGQYALVRLLGDISAQRKSWGAILALATPHLETAVAITEESGFVAVMEGGQIRYLNKILPAREIRYDRDISRTRPAHCVASGIVLLAAGSDAALDAYCDDRALSADDVAEVHRVVDLARRDGVYVNLKGVVEGAAGISAPIFDAQGRALAAVNISGPQARIAAYSDRVTKAVLETARAVTEDIGRRAYGTT